jgi:F-type H+-transporting ATPase subunit gamma
MAGAKEIRGKIASIKNSKKITKAMEMVAVGKLRKTQARMRAARPYAEKIRKLVGHVKVVGHIGDLKLENQRPLNLANPANAIGLVVISTDRGLCGSLNMNLFKAALGKIREARQKNAKVFVSVIGNKALQYFKRLKDVEVVASAVRLGDQPHVQDLAGPVKVMLDMYRDGQIDHLHLVNNVYFNTMTQKSEITQLLPLQTLDEGELQDHWDYIYEPSSTEILGGLLKRYMEAQVYRGAVENVACEMAARMVAMKAASDNADKLIDELQLIYNKARQAAITKELSEIVGGAAAV